MARINWSEKAQEDYWRNIEYLLEKFTSNEAIAFIEKVEAILLIIERKPLTFQKSDYKNIHFVPIVPQVTLFYQVINNQPVKLVRFWNNYQDPERFSFK